MPFSISEFKAEISKKDSFQRTNKFLVTFASPRVLVNYQTNVVRSMRFWVMDINLPGYAMASNEVRRYTYGAAEKRPFGPAFEDLRMVVMMDTKTDNWDFFHSWMQSIIPHDMSRGIDATNTTIGTRTGAAPYELEYRQNYVTDLNIICYDEGGNAKLQVVCREAFPLAIGDVEFSWSDTNKIALLPITMTYVDWYYENAKDAPKPK
jgi:hypothetical protein